MSFDSIPHYFLDRFMDLAPDHRTIDIALVEELVSPLRRLQGCARAVLFDEKRGGSNDGAIQLQGCCTLTVREPATRRQLSAGRFSPPHGRGIEFLRLAR